MLLSAKEWLTSIALQRDPHTETDPTEEAVLHLVSVREGLEVILSEKAVRALMAEEKSLS